VADKSRDQLCVRERKATLETPRLTGLRAVIAESSQRLLARSRTFSSDIFMKL